MLFPGLALFSIVPFIGIAFIIWALFDLANHWEETVNNAVWLVAIFMGGIIGVGFYYFMVYQPRENKK